jgi:subtilase family serine protease
MKKWLIGGVLSAAVAFGFACNANASNTPVEKSGNTYHRAVCGHTIGTAARCHAHVVTNAAGQELASAVPPIAGKTPAMLRDAYKITADGSSSTVIAIVDAFGYDNAEADLGVYRAQWGLPACTAANGCFKKLNQRGNQRNYPAQNVGWAQESALDLDMASAMCPNCQLWLVEADTNSLKNLAQSVDTAAGLGAHVISNSYGGGELKNTLRWAPSYDHPGIAITASTGDSGYGAQSPADMPTVIAVGGTHLVADSSDRGWSETVWHGAGSGCSDRFAKPVWQIDGACKNHRMIGDVSAVADPATGVAVYGPTASGNSAWLVFGGTSVSAPLVGGIFGANGGTVNGASTIYAHPSALFDVTVGSNGTCGTDAKKQYYCNGEVGFDGPTGLGTPNGTTAFGD